MSLIGTVLFKLTIKGFKGQEFTMMVHKDATIEELYQLLERKTGVPHEHARLIHTGKEIQSNEYHELISDYNGIVHGSVLFMVLRLLGGSETQEGDRTDVETTLDSRGQRSRCSCAID